MPRCPICEMELDRDRVDPKLRTEHDGRTYFFCCMECKGLFDRAPAKFAAP